MRPIPRSVVVLSAAGTAQAPSVKQDDDAARAAKAPVLASKAFERFSLQAAEVPLVLEREPVLMWTIPVVESVHGAVLVWTANGRPQKITFAASTARSGEGLDHQSAGKTPFGQSRSRGRFGACSPFDHH
jgi:hypothetical protein